MQLPQLLLKKAVPLLLLLKAALWLDGVCVMRQLLLLLLLPLSPKRAFWRFLRATPSCIAHAQLHATAQAISAAAHTSDLAVGRPDRCTQ